MLIDITIIFAAFVIIMFILAIRWESTVLFMLDAAFSFIMAVMVRLVVFPYAFIDSADVVTTGTFLVDDVSATILFFVIGILNVVLYFAFRVQHSAEELEGGEKDE